MNEFQKLQARYQALNERYHEMRRELIRQYGDHWKAPCGKQDKLAALDTRTSAAMERVFVWLDENSPRFWRTGCPAYWICEELTYEDAMTTGPLSVIPPLCWGQTPDDMRRFAAALPEEEFSLVS